MAMAVIKVSVIGGSIQATVERGEDYYDFIIAAVNGYVDKKMAHNKTVELYARIANVVAEFNLELDGDIINKNSRHTIEVSGTTNNSITL